LYPVVVNQRVCLKVQGLKYWQYTTLRLHWGYRWLPPKGRLLFLGIVLR